MSTPQERTEKTASSPRRHLGEFLRVRREQLSPLAAGFASTRRRRTPGLRREEVAQLAGISPEWYTYLEQGRDIRPSREVLGAVADALRLTAAERRYLEALATAPESPEMLFPELPASLKAFLDEQGYRPAYVVDQLWNLVGWNAACAALFPGLEHATSPPNLVEFVFLDRAWRALYRDWETHARAMLAHFRVTSVQYANDERCRALRERLLANPTFAAMWREHDVRAPSSGRKELDHPRLGHLSLVYATFVVRDDPNLTLVTFTPTDDSTRARLRTFGR
jgi:transcriptional regulator with XRE-family HTH domain